MFLGTSEQIFDSHGRCWRTNLPWRTFDDFNASLRISCRVSLSEIEWHTRRGWCDAQRTDHGEVLVAKPQLAEKMPGFEYVRLDCWRPREGFYALHHVDRDVWFLWT